jgi:hypothetical protein
VLPAGHVRLESVTIDGTSYTDFDADALTVSLPRSSERLTVTARLRPTEETRS